MNSLRLSTKRLFTPLVARQSLRPMRFSTEAPKEEAAVETVETLKAQLAKQQEDAAEALKAKDETINEIKDAYRRALADAENVRQRSKKELAEKHDYAITKFAKDLLSTADVLSLALDAVPEAERGEDSTHKDLKNLYVGVDMTRKELLKAFAKYSIVPFNPMDEPFDFNLHTAIFQTPMPGKEPGTIFHVDKVGYKIKDRVLRSAQVGVVKDNE